MIVWSAPALTSCWPSGRQASAKTWPLWPLISSRTVPVPVSQIAIALWSPSVARLRPSGDHATTLTPVLCLRILAQAQVAASQTRAVPSKLAVAMYSSSHDQETDTTHSVCPGELRERTACPNVPDHQCPVVVANARQSSGIRRPGCIYHQIGVSTQDARFGPCIGIPKAQQAVGTPNRQVSAIRRPSHAVYAVIAGDSRNDLSCRDNLDLHGERSCDGKVAAIGNQGRMRSSPPRPSHGRRPCDDRPRAASRTERCRRRRRSPAHSRRATRQRNERYRCDPKGSQSIDRTSRPFAHRPQTIDSESARVCRCTGCERLRGARMVHRLRDPHR